MSDTLKRTLLIIGLIITTAILAFALYYLFKKVGPLAKISPGQVTTTTETITLPGTGQRIQVPATTGTVSGALPTAGYIPSIESGYDQPDPITQLSDVATNYVSLNQSGNFRYYNEGDGKFYQLQTDGSTKPLSDQAFYNVQNATWANNADKAVLEYPDNSKIIYDFTKEKQVTLPKHWEDFSFSEDSTEIAAKSIGLSPENRWLVSINDDGTGSKIIAKLGDNADKVIVDWSPSRQAVGFALTGNPLGAYRKEVYFIGLKGENFKSTIVEGMGFEPKWSSTGNKLLYSVYSQRSDLKPELWITNSYGQKIGSDRQSLLINTWANKCSFANDDTLYCAVPHSLPQGAGIKPEIAAGTADNIYKIDLTTGLKTLIPTGESYSIDSISYDENTNRLIFVDEGKTGVFEVKL